MPLKIDEYGRVLIPKKVRDTYGLEAGTELRLEEEEGRLALIPIPLQEACTEDEHGVPLYRGHAPDDAVKLVQQAREARTSRIANDRD